MSQSSSSKLTRRALFGGALASLVLPRLELDSRSARAANPGTGLQRFFAFYTPHGWHMDALIPTSTGAGYSLSPTLGPLGELGLKDDFMMLTGLHKKYLGEAGMPSGHTYETTTFLTASLPDSASAPKVSLDQAIAARTRSLTTLPSLELGNPSLPPGSTAGNDPTYLSNISWTSEGTPLSGSRLTDAAALYDLLFANVVDQADPESVRRVLGRKRVVDVMNQRAQPMLGRLGKSDQTRIEQYFDGVREIEKSLDGSASGSCERPAKGFPSYAPPITWDASLFLPDAAFEANYQNLVKLVALAYQCDITRVGTFMLSNALINTQFPFLGVTGAGHHELSHNQNDNETHDKCLAIERWQVRCFGDLVKALKEAKDPDGAPILDSTLLYFASEAGDGNGHNQRSVPVILAGKVGNFKLGEHVRFEGEPYNYDGARPMANLFVTIQKAFGIDSDSFGVSSTGPLDQVQRA